jgi:hypothetical protein
MFIWPGVAGLALWRHKRGRYNAAKIGNGACRPKEDVMTPGFSAVNKLALVLAAGVAIAACLAGSASAQSTNLQYDKRGRVTYGNGGPNAVYQQGRTRIYVSKRSWLDGGTEVLPGDRHFTDYAYPPTTSFATQNNNRPLDRQPRNPPSDLGGGEPTRFPLY